MNNLYYVYIITNKKNGTLYVGVTNNLLRRVEEHSLGIVDSFTRKYNIHTIVYYETTEDIIIAIEREKQLKKWNRLWKIRLIETENPEWKDLREDF
jgi:putative endonuclease